MYLSHRYSAQAAPGARALRASQSSSSLLSPLPSPCIDPPVDSLQLPLPPVALLFSFEAKERQQLVLRYCRDGTAHNAKRAVVGKGGFGTVYRFERDDSFALPGTFESSNPLSPPNKREIRDAGDEGNHAQLTGLSPALTTVSIADEAIETENANSASSSIVAGPTALDPGLTVGQPGPPAARRIQMQDATEKSATRDYLLRRSAAPAVVIVKVCRTPLSGAFDEMPKTGPARALARAADDALDRGDTSGFHTRVVRGEARLFRFLQIVAKKQGTPSSRTGLVRMLADLPFDSEMHANASEDAVAAFEADTGPLPRLLAFERCVELDAIMTSKGWQKRKQVWTHREVEDVIRDVALGLAFLHTNHIVHGDLKPSNIMKDAHTGSAKIIDLGASRRFICVPNLYKDSLTAVEAFDRFLSEGSVTPQAAHIVHTEGLGSLTGTPHYMAPEVLLQAGRYVDHHHISRSVLDDYVNHKARWLSTQQTHWFNMAYSDFKRGWGPKSDIWSWGITVMSLLLRAQPDEEKKSSKSVCAFDFSFEDLTDILQPRHRLLESEQNLPRFHEWSRRYPLRIMKTVQKGIRVPQQAAELSPAAVEMLKLSLTFQDSRPSATTIVKALSSSARSRSENFAGLIPTRQSSPTAGRRPLRAPSSDSLVSHVHSLHNIELGRPSLGTGSSSASLMSRRSITDCSALQAFELPSPLQRTSSLATDENMGQVMSSNSPRPGSNFSLREELKDIDMLDAKAASVREGDDEERTPQVTQGTSLSFGESAPVLAEKANQVEPHQATPIFVVEDAINAASAARESAEAQNSKLPLRRRFTVTMMSTLRNFIPRHSHRRTTNSESISFAELHSAATTPAAADSHEKHMAEASASNQGGWQEVKASEPRSEAAATGQTLSPTSKGGRPAFIRLSSKQATKSAVPSIQSSARGCSVSSQSPSQILLLDAKVPTGGKPRSRASLSALGSRFRSRSRGESVSQAVSASAGVRHHINIEAPSQETDGDAIMGAVLPQDSSPKLNTKGNWERSGGRSSGSVGRRSLLVRNKNLTTVLVSESLLQTASPVSPIFPASASSPPASLRQDGMLRGGRKRSCTTALEGVAEYWEKSK